MLELPIVGMPASISSVSIWPDCEIVGGVTIGLPVVMSDDPSALFCEAVAALITGAPDVMLVDERECA